MCFRLSLISRSGNAYQHGVEQYCDHKERHDYKQRAVRQPCKELVAEHVEAYVVVEQRIFYAETAVVEELQHLEPQLGHGDHRKEHAQHHCQNVPYAAHGALVVLVA